MLNSQSTEQISDSSFEVMEGDDTMNQSTSIKTGSLSDITEEQKGLYDSTFYTPQSKINVLLHVVGLNRERDMLVELPSETGASQANIGHMTEKALKFLGMKRKDCAEIVVKGKIEEFGQKLLELGPDIMVKDAMEYEMLISTKKQENELAEKEKEQIKVLEQKLEQMVQFRKDLEEAKRVSIRRNEEHRTTIAEYQQRNKELLKKVEVAQNRIIELGNKMKLKSEEWENKEKKMKEKLQEMSATEEICINLILLALGGMRIMANSTTNLTDNIINNTIGNTWNGNRPLQTRNGNSQGQLQSQQQKQKVSSGQKQINSSPKEGKSNDVAKMKNKINYSICQLTKQKFENERKNHEGVQPKAKENEQRPQPKACPAAHSAHGTKLLDRVPAMDMRRKAIMGCRGENMPMFNRYRKRVAPGNKGLPRTVQKRMCYELKYNRTRFRRSFFSTDEEDEEDGPFGGKFYR